MPLDKGNRVCYPEMGVSVWVCYTLFETELGWMGLVGSGAGLRRIALPQPSPEEALQVLLRGLPGANADPSPFGDLPHRLERYFSGERVTFSDELDLADATPFRSAVWQATRSVPYGQTQSYAGIAQQIGRPTALRAVGQALAKNPFPIVVPCHRVVGKDGSLRGFGGGLEMKRHLLEMESSTTPSTPDIEPAPPWLRQPFLRVLTAYRAWRRRPGRKRHPLA